MWLGDESEAIHALLDVPRCGGKIQGIYPRFQQPDNAVGRENRLESDHCTAAFRGSEPTSHSLANQPLGNRGKTYVIENAEARINFPMSP